MNCNITMQSKLIELFKIQFGFPPRELRVASISVASVSASLSANDNSDSNNNIN
jgi:hypothetical protein